MATKKINLTQQIEVPLPYVFYSFNNKSGWMEWFAHKAYGYAKKKAMLRVYYEPEGDFAFYFTDEQAEERLAFDFIDLSTMHISKVAVGFEEEDGAVTVSLEHTGISEEKYDELKSIWENSLANLKSVLETGRDLRMWNRPFLGVTVQEWVTPELAQEQNLPVEHGMQLSSVITGRGAEDAGLEKGDIIVSLDGQDLHGYKLFLDLIRTHKAGDTVDLSYYRGAEKHDIEIQLSSYPVSEPPATAHDYAEKIEKYQKKIIKKLSNIFEDYNEAQVEYRPGAGEKSAKDTLVHLLAYESDIHTWVTTLVAGCEEYPCSSAHAIRIKGLLSLYPTVDELIEELTRRQAETVAILLELPAEFINRRGSFTRLATGLNFDYSKTYKEKLNHIKESLEKAENLRVS